MTRKTNEKTRAGGAKANLYCPTLIQHLSQSHLISPRVGLGRASTYYAVLLDCSAPSSLYDGGNTNTAEQRKLAEVISGVVISGRRPGNGGMPACFLSKGKNMRRVTF